MPPFSALADPIRREIIEILALRERSAGEIASHFEVSHAAISQHLGKLKEAKLVAVRVEAQRRIYSLDPAGFLELNRWLAEIRQFWSGRFEDLPNAVPAAGRNLEQSDV